MTPRHAGIPLGEGTFGPPHLIASDVDGTLVDEANRVGGLTKAMIGNAVRADCAFVIATGRPPRWIAEIADQLEHPPYAVCANGAIIYDFAHDRILHSWTLPTDTLAALATMAYNQIPGCGLAAERVGASAHDAVTPPFVATPDYRHAWLNPDHIRTGEDEVLGTPATKLLVRQPNLTSDEMARRLATVVGDLAAITFSTSDGLVELTPPGVSKATGIQMLAEIVGLPTDSVVAFGDMPNDVEMLSWAHRGVAMSNAHPLARGAADEVTTSNLDNGVGRVLARWFS